MASRKSNRKAERRTNENDDKELDQLYESVMNCHPIVPPDEMDKYADLVFSKEHVIRAWRAAAFLGSKDGKFYKELADDKSLAKVTAPIVEPLIHSAKIMRDMAEIMDSVAARISVAGCNHRDFKKWAAEGKAVTTLEASHG